VKCEDGVACLHILNTNETVYNTDTVVSNEASDSVERVLIARRLRIHWNSTDQRLLGPALLNNETTVTPPKEKGHPKPNTKRSRKTTQMKPACIKK